MNGYVWFIAQSMSFTLSLMALYYAMRQKGGLSLAFWACAVGCRPMLALYGILLVYLLVKGYQRQNPKGSVWQLIKEKWYWLIGCGAIAISYTDSQLCPFWKYPQNLDIIICRNLQERLQVSLIFLI